MGRRRVESRFWQQIGEYLFREDVSRDHHTRFVSDQTWDDVQEAKENKYASQEYQDAMAAFL